MILRTLLLAFVSLTIAGQADEAKKPNVLLIAIDDLNDWVSPLNGHAQSHTPNIERLAKRGVLFTNAHCQAPICNPSRTSIMLGRRPSSTGIYVNSPQHWRKKAELGDVVTLPRHFAANGYLTLTAGKIYHGSGLPEGDFDVIGPRPGQRNGKLDRRIQEDLKGLWDFGPQSFPDEKFGDHQIASWAIEQLGKTHEQPILLALGFYRPHVPLYAPQRWFDHLGEPANLPPVKKDDREDLPKAAIELTKNPTPPPHDWFAKNNDQNWKEAVHAYHACVRFTDEQVGRVLDALDKSPHRDNTMIILYSDHGFHLGEKQRWAKQSLWERSTRVPFIVVTPEKLSAGTRCSKPAELLSIYPTLIDLCQIEKRSDLEGVSLMPLLRQPAKTDWPHVAITTYQQNNHAIRDETHRYIRYADGSEELYDHRSDPNEWTNLASREESKGVIEKLSKHLPKRVSN